MRGFLGFVLGAGLGALGTYGFRKQPRRRQRRHTQFLSHPEGTTIGISHDLLGSVRLLMRHALNERREPVWRSAHNHATHFTPTIIITITTALDAWLNELVAFGRSHLQLSEEQVAGVIDIGTVPEKYERTSAL